MPNNVTEVLTYSIHEVVPYVNWLTFFMLGDSNPVLQR